MTTSTLRERTAFRSSSSPGRRSLAPEATSVNSITVQPRALAKARSGTSWLSVFWSVVETRPYNPAFAPAPKGLAVGPPVAVGLRWAKDGAGIATSARRLRAAQKSQQGLLTGGPAPGRGTSTGAG